MCKDFLKKMESILKTLKTKGVTSISEKEIKELIYTNKHYQTEFYLDSAKAFLSENGIKIDSYKPKKKETKKKVISDEKETNTEELEDIDDENEEIDEKLFDTYENEKEENYQYYPDEGIENSILNTDSTRAYLKEIGNYKLLSQEEEVELFKRIEQGDESAKEEIINANLRLVVSIAKYYASRNPETPLLDFIQDGNMGLMVAVDRFDYKLGYKFSTYATHWIRQKIIREAVNSGRIIRIPVHASEQARYNNQAIAILMTELNRMPTINEVSDYINEHHMLVQSYKHMTPETVLLLMTTNGYSMLSLDKPVGESKGENDVDSVLGDFIPAPEITEEHVEDKELHDLINSIMDERLTAKERDVINKRFGLNGYDPCTLEVIGKEYGLTRERIRQIESKALKKLRRKAVLQKFGGYSDGL